MIRRQTVLIQEGRRKWVATNLYFATQRRYNTLSDALNAIKRADAEDAKNGITSITRIEVDTRTKAGKAVAEVLLKQ